MEHYGITALLPQPLDPSEGLVVQYEARYTNTTNCGGSYLKLLTHAKDFKPEDLEDSTPYSVMFGPDKCDPKGKVG
jgi:calnexin